MVSRRSLLGTPLWGALALDAAAQGRAGRADQSHQVPAAAPAQLPIASGPFQPTADSLKTYQTPAWFRDAKFGIWAHWGPQAVPRSGDWYARFMYVPGHPHYAHHLKHYGHPSEFG
jgi:alpha-L-fucosidase